MSAAEPLCLCGHHIAQHDTCSTILDNFDEQCLVSGCRCLDFEAEALAAHPSPGGEA